MEHGIYVAVRFTTVGSDLTLNHTVYRLTNRTAVQMRRDTKVETYRYDGKKWGYMEENLEDMDGEGPGIIIIPGQKSNRR